MLVPSRSASSRTRSGVGVALGDGKSLPEPFAARCFSASSASQT